MFEVFTLIIAITVVGIALYMDRELLIKKWKTVLYGDKHER